MALSNELVQTGNFLFRHRSYLPAVLVVLYAAGLLLDNQHPDLVSSMIWQWFCFTVCLSGLIIRIATVGKVPIRTSGRNTKTQRAEVLNQTGIYSVVRHPLYLGNYFLWAGMFLLLASGWVFVIYSLSYWLYYERIMLAEEHFLKSKFGVEFENWTKKTPAFIPSFKSFRSNEKPFNLKMVVRREYTTVSAMVILFILLNQLNAGMHQQKWSIPPETQKILLLTSGFYIVLRSLKKLGKL